MDFIIYLVIFKHIIRSIYLNLFLYIIIFFFFTRHISQYTGAKSQDTFSHWKYRCN